MYSTYCRLGVHVYASDREVIRAASRMIKPVARYSRTEKAARKRFYGDMLRCHSQAGALCRRFKL